MAKKSISKSKKEKQKKKSDYLGKSKICLDKDEELDD